ncbi:hypothetical protein ARALYDRAFT_919346 [Arabidopsis lyrata subsp. lyrata]|uniref:histone deacetylase n=1 Tax=Arabidopsis lyrata subsp. lyrata TaxID=81972 RepID=D7MUH1_ARALL|nr:hypothetical protein ARALYDRAFT_919346 [Arabidopsis lyrata subsp. lyrata]
MTMTGESSGKKCGDGGGKVAGKSQRKVGLVYDETMCKHDTPNGEVDVECPDRIRFIWEKLQLAGVTQRCVVLGGSKAEDKHLKLVHTKKHVNFVKSISTKQKDSRRNRIASVLDSIYLNGGSSEAAYLAAGSVVNVAEKVAEGELDCGFAIVRPPGHHAEADEAMGFCLFNNVAVAASYLLNERSHSFGVFVLMFVCFLQMQPDLGVKKILIVDWDIHHGNGTQKMFWKDPRVLIFSVHRFKVAGNAYVARYDHGSFYPASDDGDYNMVGEGPGKGFNINVPWEQGGCGDADYLAAWDHILIPVTKEFNPDIILLSAGFDAAIGDPLGGCCITPDGYSVMLKKLMEFAQGKIVLALEGGYNLESLAKSSLACVQVLLEEKGIQCSSGAYPLESTRRVIRAVRERLCTYWPSLADELSCKLIDQKTLTPVGHLSSCLPFPSSFFVGREFIVTGARTEGPNLTVLPSLEPRSTSHLSPHSHLSVTNKRKAPASGLTSSYRFSELEDVMVEKVLPSFQEEVMGMEFQDCIAFGKEISYKENRELRYNVFAASDTLMTSNENLKNLSADKNPADAILHEVEELKSLWAARDGELEARRKELKAKKMELETWLMLVGAREDEFRGLRAKVESLMRERDEAVAKAERLDKELQEERPRSRLENEEMDMDSEDEDMDMDSEELEHDLKTMSREFKKDINLVFEKFKKDNELFIGELKKERELAITAAVITTRYQVCREWKSQGTLSLELKFAAEVYHKLRSLIEKRGKSHIYATVEMYEEEWKEFVGPRHHPTVTVKSKD